MGSIWDFILKLAGYLGKGLFSALLEHPTEQKEVYKDVKKDSSGDDDPFSESDY